MSKKNRVNINMRGQKVVISNLNKEIQKIKFRSLKGLLLAAAHVRRDMEKTPPLIPVDTGNLRGSWSVVSSRSFLKGQAFVIMGFTAGYAARIEFAGKKPVEPGKEAPKKRTRERRPNSGPFFFTSALNRNHDNILKIIRTESKIK